MIHSHIKFSVFQQIFHRFMFTNRQVISNSVALYLIQASGKVLLAQPNNLGLPSWIYHRKLPVPSLDISKYNINLPSAFGKCRTGGLVNLLFTSVKAASCSLPHTKGLSLQVNSTMGLNNTCKSGQKSDR